MLDETRRRGFHPSMRDPNDDEPKLTPIPDVPVKRQRAGAALAVALVGAAACGGGSNAEQQPPMVVEADPPMVQSEPTDTGSGGEEAEPNESPPPMR